MEFTCPECGCISNIKKSSDPNVKLFFEVYTTAYVDKFPEAELVPIHYGKDGKDIKKLLKHYEVPALSKLLQEYFNTPHNFFAENGYNIPCFIKFIYGKQTGGYNGSCSGQKGKGIGGVGRGVRDRARQELGIRRGDIRPSATILQADSQSGDGRRLGKMAQELDYPFE